MAAAKTAQAITSSILFLAFAGCSATPSDPIQELRTAFMRDGIISIYRQAPPVKDIMDSGTMLGFVPLPALRHGAWASIDRSSGNIELRDGDAVVASIPAQGLNNLKPGLHHVLHKQKAPLWYATDGYYAKRGLPTPPQGDRSRFLRGALGSMALYLDKDTPIHSGAVWASDVGGLRMEEADLSRLYYSLPVGAPIEIK